MRLRSRVLVSASAAVASSKGARRFRRLSCTERSIGKCREESDGGGGDAGVADNYEGSG